MAVKNKMNAQARELEKIIPDYSYADEAKALITDEHLCGHLVAELREIKDKLFAIIDVAFEKHPQLSREFRQMRDDVDIFSDEIKVHHPSFRQVPDEFLERIVRHDKDLVDDVQGLMKQLHTIYQTMLGYTPVTVHRDIAVYDTSFSKEIRRSKEEAKRQLVKMVIHFKEREILCNIKRISLEKTYQRLKNELEAQYSG